MRKNAKPYLAMMILTLLLFGVSPLLESSAWARAGSGGSFGSRGSRSFSSPQMPSKPSPTSPGMNTPGRNPSLGTPGQPSPGFFGRSPFLQGLAGGLAGGMLGSLLFGGVGHASPGGMAGGGIGFLEIVIIGLLLYLAWSFLKKRRARNAVAGYPGADTGIDDYARQGAYYNESQPELYPPVGEVERGFQQLRQFDPAFDEEALKEKLQDIFFRIQAGWMNRRLDGIEGQMTDEMIQFFRNQFDAMKQTGRVNRLENIAIRKVEPSEVWQEMGKDYVTVLFTANLLDYTVDETTGQIVSGDNLNPVKFQEFWTFCRDVGSPQWRLSAINQLDDESVRTN